MSFIEKTKKLLASNQIGEAINEYLNLLNNCPESEKEAKKEANELSDQIIILSAKFNGLREKINLGTVKSETAEVEKSEVLHALTQTLKQLPSIFPALNNYILENDEEQDWHDAQHKNTIDGYHQYFNKYPNGKYKSDTLRILNEMEDLKQKQDNEFKKFALLKKESRENDSPAEKIQKAPAAYQSGSASASTSPVKSKMGLFIGIGIVVVAAVVIFLITGKKSTDNSNSQLQTEENSAASIAPENADAIDATMYYIIQNRGNSLSLAVLGASTENEASIIVLSSEDPSANDFQKFELRGIDPYNLIVKHSGMCLTVMNDNFLSQKTIPETFGTFQTFKFVKNEEGFYQIEDLAQTGNVLGLDAASEGFADGQKVISMKNDYNEKTQWKLIKTKDQVSTEQ